MTSAADPAPLRVLSVIPPMTQLNTPYPSTAQGRSLLPLT
jgi:hypothetical protein